MGSLESPQKGVQLGVRNNTTNANMLAVLTDVQVRGAKPAAKAFKLFDGGGLFLLVKPNGKKFWRYKYRIAGTENLVALGQYPEDSLKEVREAHKLARKLVWRGIHPARQRKADRLAAVETAANTFRAIAQEWISKNRKRWSPYYVKQIETTLVTYVYPHVGELPIEAVHSSHLFAIVERVEEHGTRKAAPTTAILIRQWSSAIFRYTAAKYGGDHNPTWALKGAINRPKVKHKTALSASEIALLLIKIDDAHCTPKVKIALKLLMLTFVRPGELRNAVWSEFDLDIAEWRIPAERMKMREKHVVPLSWQAIVLLRSLKGLNGDSIRLFPNERRPKEVMSTTTLNRCLERLGYAGTFSAHGFRATASTWLNKQKERYDPDWIERQLAHAPRNKIRAAYNREEYLSERTKMMQDWADQIDKIIGGDCSAEQGEFNCEVRHPMS